MPLSFASALLMFLILQVAVFLVLLLLSERFRTSNILKIPHNVSATLIRVLYVLLIIGILTKTFARPGYTLLCDSLIVLTPAILIFLVAAGASFKLMLPVAIMWHYMIIAPEIEESFVSITEGVHMTRTMILYGKWIPELAHNPSYNPFPTMAFTRAALSFLTAFPWYNLAVVLPLLIAVLTALDLAVYIFSSRISADDRVGVLAVIIFALTPYLVVTSHAYQIPATLLWLLSTYMFIQLLGTPQHRYLILMILFFVSAILTHTTAYIEMSLLAVFFSMKYFGGIVNSKFSERRHSYVETAIMMIVIIGLARLVIESLYVYYVGKMFFETVEGLVVRIFLGEELDTRLTLYDYGNVPFHQAFLWSLTASLACALIIQSLLKKSVNLLLLSLFLSACVFLGFGYLTAIIMKNTTQVYRGPYVAFMLLVPLAALATRKIIDSKSKPLIITLVLMILLASCLALNDPEISPRAARKTRGIPEEIESSSTEDLIKANYIMNFAEDPTIINNLTLYSENVVVYERLTTFGKKIKTVYSEVGDALYKVLYINGYTWRDAALFQINHVLPEEFREKISASNVIYCSGKESFILETPESMWR